MDALEHLRALGGKLRRGRGYLRRAMCPRRRPHHEIQALSAAWAAAPDKGSGAGSRRNALRNTLTTRAPAQRASIRSAEDSEHAALTDPKLQGDMTLFDVLGRQALDLFGFRSSGGGTPLVPLFGLGLRHSFALSLEHHLTFELGDSSDHIEHQLAGRRAGIHPDV